MDAGGYAGSINPYNMLQKITQEFLSTENYLINYESAEDIVLPVNDFYMFQTDSSGTNYFLDTVNNVLCYSPASKSFETVANLENFTQYILHCLIENKSWEDLDKNSYLFMKYNLNKIQLY